MLLHSLLKQLDPSIPLTTIPNVEVRGVREDSRLVQTGDVFVARPGTKEDGARFIADAKARGAIAVVAQTAQARGVLPTVIVPDTAAAASILANRFHGNPGEKVRVLGVTGTNGKTTTTYLVRHLLAKANLRCGLVGTVEIDDGRSRRPAEQTTPGACDVASLLASMRDKGCRACAVEVSSHALDQGRVAGVPLAGAAFTNLTGDHLDYHKTMDAYAAAKARLFATLSQTSVAVVNDGDKWTDRMIQGCCGRIIRFGFGKAADYRAREVTYTAQGTSFNLQTPDGKADVTMPLIGKFNVENALAAAGLAGEVFHLTAQQIATGLRDAGGAPGRLQQVRCGQPFAVLVDYAHTDDALENVLESMRPLTRGRLRVLFGCGGDRDATKRPRMARTAERLADVVYVTSDNPRTEDPQRIIENIVAGLTPAGRRAAMVEPDRRAAITRILSDASDGDVVIIAGKGHETYQDVAGVKHHFDDVEEATKVLQNRAAAAA